MKALNYILIASALAFAIQSCSNQPADESTKTEETQTTTEATCDNCDALFADNFAPYPDLVNSRASRGPGTSDLSQAMKSFKKGEYSESLGYFDSYINMFPEHHKVKLYRGLAYLKLSQADMAMRDFNEVINNDKQFAEPAVWYMALAQVKAGNKEQAVAYLQKVKSKQAVELQAQLEGWNDKKLEQALEAYADQPVAYEINKEEYKEEKAYKWIPLNNADYSVVVRDMVRGQGDSHAQIVYPEDEQTGPENELLAKLEREYKITPDGKYFMREVDNQKLSEYKPITKSTLYFELVESELLNSGVTQSSFLQMHPLEIYELIRI